MEEKIIVTPSSQSSHGLTISEATISEATIKAIVKHALPELAGDIIVEPESFTSFSNRIYAVSCGMTPKKYILKVNGRFFGAPKMESEVGCLLLQETFCPTVPVPRVVAWSTSIGKITKRGSTGGLVVDDVDELKGEDIPGWILMTRLPGKPLELSKLTAAQKSSIIEQLVRITLCWRRNIHWSAWAGDLRFAPHHTEISQYLPAAKTSLPPLYIHGLSGIGKGLAPPMGSMLYYWQSNLRCLTDELQTEEIFSPNRESLSLLLQDCIDKVLPKLSILKPNQPHEFVFTHCDLAPRNILVSPYYPSVITGIVDFEFCGFFPTWSQFFAYVTDGNLLNEAGTENPDWPVEMYRSFVKALAQRGVATPYGYEQTREWKELANLMSLERNTAPPGVRGLEGSERQRALGEARRAVEVAVGRLKKLSE